MDRPGSISFLEFRIDPERGELQRNGEPVRVEPQVLDLIAYLAQHAGRLVTRDELIEGVWGGRIVSDSAISSRINAARLALDDDGNAQRVIKTVPRRGFRFEAQVDDASGPKTVQLPDKPSVAVLPFRNLSGDPEQTYFSDGITDDIITDLSRYPELFVSARHSSFTYSSPDIDGTEIAADLGVHYVVTGSVRRSGGRIRVTANLSDPWAGTQLWAERYDRDLTDIFEVQDEITSIIVNTLTGEISRQHRRQSLTKSAEKVSAYDHVLRSLDYVWRFDPDGHAKAIEASRNALALDPRNARAHAMVSWARLHFYSNALSDNPAEELRLSAEAARAAVDADDNEPWAHSVLGWVFQWRDRATDRALAELDRAVSLNPGNAHFRSLRAFSLTYAGQSERAFSELEETTSLNPHFPVAYHIFFARALFNLGRYDEAVWHAEIVRTSQAHHPNALAMAAACFAANGQMDDAYATAATLRRRNSRFTTEYAAEVLPYELVEERDRFVGMLRRSFSSE